MLALNKRDRRRVAIQIRRRQIRAVDSADTASSHEETQRVRNDPDLMKSIRESKRAKEEGRSVPLEEARKEVLG